ncbi:MAG: hypothetical protein JRN66_04265 [Nitrososphaerota archaeon]|nr:hypothetical protein [Nitrososphaerota archaeon]
MKWATATFSLTYALLNLAYLPVSARYQVNDIVIFLTSPFNMIEVTGSASYIISACCWFLRGMPCDGTSIIAFSMLMFPTASAVLDMKKCFEALVWTAALVPSLAAAPWYILHNASWPLHVSGALVFGGLYALYLSLMHPFKPLVHVPT